jgi:hypothetical protein
MEHEQFDYKVCASCTKPSSKDPAVNDPPVQRRLRYALHRRIRHDNAAAGFEISDQQVRELGDRLMHQLKPFFLTDDTCIDNFVDQVLEVPSDLKPSWTGRRVHPLLPSVDAFFIVVKGEDKKTTCHAPGNVTVISDSLNRLFRHLPKYLLHPVCDMVNTKEPGIYSRAVAVMRDALINSYEMRPFSEALASVRLGKPCPKDFAKIMEAQRVNKLLPRTVSKAEIWRTTIHPYGDGAATWEFPHFEWHKRQLERALERYGLTSSECRALCFRNGVFFPFARDSVVLRWNWYDCFCFFVTKMRRMRDLCDRHYRNQANRPDCSPGELMVAVAHLWMRMVSRDYREQGFPARLCGRDEAGLIPHPTIRMLITSSVGHKVHGKQMLTGVTNYDPTNGVDCGFDSQLCNICWETQACNQMKWEYNDTEYDELFLQLRKGPRLNPVVGTPVSLPAKEEITSELRDELASQDPPASHTEKSRVFDSSDLDRSLAEVEDQAEDGAEFDFGYQQHPGDLDKHVPVGRVRCQCGVHGNASEEATDLICCSQCGTFQHLACVRLSNDVYLCPLCTLQDQLQLEIVPHKRNKGRLGMTCYISAAVQLVCELSEVRRILEQPYQFRLQTGRSDSDLEYVDDSPEKSNIKSFFRSLQELFLGLQQGGPKLDPILTRNLLDAAHSIHPRWADVALDSGDFYGFLIEMLSMISDVSESTTKQGDITALRQFNTSLELDARSGTALRTLTDDSSRAAAAWKA